MTDKYSMEIFSVDGINVHGYLSEKISDLGKIIDRKKDVTPIYGGRSDKYLFDGIIVSTYDDKVGDILCFSSKYKTYHGFSVETDINNIASFYKIKLKE